MSKQNNFQVKMSHVSNCASRQFVADVDEEAKEEILAQEYVELQAVTHVLPPVWVQDEVAQLLGHGVLMLETLDFKALIDMHCAHQTHQADKGVCTCHSRED